MSKRITYSPDAGYWEDGHPRNEAVSALKEGSLERWKVESGYHRRSIGEKATIEIWVRETTPYPMI